MTHKNFYSSFKVLGSLLFVLFVSSISAQELTMFQGPFAQQFYEDDQKISRSVFLDRINSVPESAAHWKSYKTNNAIATISSLGTGVGIYWWVSRDDGDSKTAPIIATLGGFVLTSVFAQKALSHQRDAILAYNKNETGAYHVLPSKNGMGLTVHF